MRLQHGSDAVFAVFVEFGFVAVQVPPASVDVFDLELRRLQCVADVNAAAGEVIRVLADGVSVDGPGGAAHLDTADRHSAEGYKNLHLVHALLRDLGRIAVDAGGNGIREGVARQGVDGQPRAVDLAAVGGATAVANAPFALRTVPRVKVRIRDPAGIGDRRCLDGIRPIGDLLHASRRHIGD